MTGHRSLQIAALSTSAALLAIAGCQSEVTTLNALLAPEPPEVAVFADTTQPVRDYPRSVATIQNGDTAAESTGFRWKSRDDTNPALTPIVETGVFLGNLGTLPYTSIEQRGTVVSSGLQFPPTYTAMPPLPPEQAQPEPPSGGVETPSEMSTIDLGMPATQMTAPTPEVSPADVLARTTTQPDAPQFTISGQVVRPGTYDARDGLKLSQVILAAEPATAEREKVRVQIDRPGEESAVTTLDQLVSGAVEDVAVKSGDTITISVLP